MTELSPAFVHFGLAVGSTCVCSIGRIPLADKSISDGFVVGTAKGRCILYAEDDHDVAETLYEDLAERHIVGIGTLPHRFLARRDSDAESVHPLPIWIHFRASAVELFRWQWNDRRRSYSLVAVRKIATNHYGFCQATFDVEPLRFLVPDEDNGSVVKIVTNGGGERRLLLSEEYMRKASKTEDSSSKAFCGTVMFIRSLPCVDGSSNKLLLAFEDSTTAVFDIQTKHVDDFVKHPKYNELLTVALPELRAPASSLPIAVSVIGQVYILTYDCGSHCLTPSHVVRRSKFSETNCSAMALSPGASPRLACGLTSGLVEFYSSDLRTLVSTMDFHEAAINYILWLSGRGNPSDKGEGHADSSAIVCSADEKLSLASVPNVV